MRFSQGPLGPTTAITDSTTTVDSPVLDISQKYGYAIQAVWTGEALAGSCQIMGSIDYNPNTGEGDWSPIGDPFAVSGPGSFLSNVPDTFYLYVQVVFTYASGTGTIQFYQSTKGP